MTFWTMNPTDDDPRQSVTLCEHHALEETNAALEFVGDLGEPFGSMSEAYAVLTALSALSGFDYGLDSSERGECAICIEASRPADSLEESA